MRFPGKDWLWRITDVRVTVVIGVVAMAAGGWYYHGPGYNQINLDRNQYEPAVLWATGHGYAHAKERPPALAAFLNGSAEHLEPKELPDEMQVVPADTPDDTDRIYLFIATGIIWRIFGVDWAWIPLLVGIGVGVITVLLYGIFRLGMSRPISLACTLLAVSSPLMHVMFPELRDFWKGPFILATILVAGYFLSRPVETLRFLLLSTLAGAVAGIGYGFRQDCIICLPPALFAVAVLAHRQEGRLGLGIRALGTLLFLGGFAALASPVLLWIWNTGGNNALYLMQGQAIYCQETMGMRRACYSPVAQSDDVFVVASIYVHSARSSREHSEIVSKDGSCFSAPIARYLTPLVNKVAPPKEIDALERDQLRRTLMFWQGVANIFCIPLPTRLMGFFQVVNAFSASDSPTGDAVYGYRGSTGVEKAGRRLTMHLYSTFPADVISRCYASALHIVRGMRGYAATNDSVNPVYGSRGNPDHRNYPKLTWYSWHMLIEKHLETYGEYYALAALLIISAHSTWMALVALGVILYFCGYVGIFFQDRHAYHLEFVGLWLFAFCVEHVLLLLRQMFSRQGLRQIFFTTGCFRKKLMYVKRATAFLAIAFIVLSLPLGVARWWQRGTVSDLLHMYRTCQLDPIPFEEKSDSESGSYYGAQGPQERPTSRFRRFFPGAAYVDPLPALLYDYYAAEFEVSKPCPPLVMRVLYRDCCWDCICSLRDDYDEGSSDGPFTVRYFFPVYQFTADHEPNHPFKGIILPPGVALKNLYRVRNQEDFLIPMNVWLFDEPGNSFWYQAFRLFGVWI